MSDTPLLISALVEHAARVFGDQQIVSRTVEGPVHRYTWRDFRRRTKRLVKALRARGIREGDRVATIAWNGHRHLELYYGVAGMGAVIHTVNPRLHPAQLVYILNHAEDRVLFVDLTFLPLVEAVVEGLESVRAIVVMTDRDHMPESALDLVCYEELIAQSDDDYEWPLLDENAAAGLCYTSGTTGNPKGVVYTHRSTILHALSLSLPPSLPPSLPTCATDVVLPVVPMFHVNAWGLPHVVAATGAKLVLPGPRLDGAGLTELMVEEGVTLYTGVPTVHLALLEYWRQTGKKVPSLDRVVNGGAAIGRSMVDAFHEAGCRVVHGWGMTETSPVGTISKLIGAERDLPEDDRANIVMRQGRPLFGVELRIVDEDGKPLPEDGEAVGELQIRGPWVCSAYFGDEPGSGLDDEGWFGTGDVARIFPDGVMQITDRVKDLIKSGGEWISSIDLEDLAMRHPEIARAAVIGVPHEKWGERPLLVAVPVPNGSPTRESVLDFLEGQVAKWWLPDDVVFVDELPLGATGKVQKSELRERFGRPQ